MGYKETSPTYNKYSYIGIKFCGEVDWIKELTGKKKLYKISSW